MVVQNRLAWFVTFFYLKEEEASLRSKVESFTSLWNKGERERLMELFAEDGILMPQGEPVLQGKEGYFSHI